MQPQKFTKPFYIFFLMMPSGISQGFVTVTLPFLLSKNGFPVSITASIVAIGLSAMLWRFLWGPVVDLSLSLRKWFWIGLLFTIATLLLLCFIPFTQKGATLLAIIVFISQVAATLTFLPVNGFMALSIRDKSKGEASGWFQAGTLGGVGIGGGAGLWLAIHYSIILSGIVLCVACILFALVILLIQDIPHNKEKTIAQELKLMGKEILSLVKMPVALFVIILLTTPIGSGAMSNLWSAVANDWNTNADTVVLVTGILSGGISAVGSVAGGFIADKRGVWIAFLGIGSISALLVLLLAIMPLKPSVYIFGVLMYAFATGMMYAAFTAIIYFVIGKSNAVTKYSLISSLGNLPVVYMTKFDGWIHDKFNSRYMLSAEGFAGIFFVIMFYLILKRMRYKKLIPSIVE